MDVHKIVDPGVKVIVKSEEIVPTASVVVSPIRAVGKTSTGTDNIPREENNNIKSDGTCDTKEKINNSF